MARDLGNKPGDGAGPELSGYRGKSGMKAFVMREIGQVGFMDKPMPKPLIAFS